jgi:hypothetical protein
VEHTPGVSETTVTGNVDGTASTAMFCGEANTGISVGVVKLIDCAALVTWKDTYTSAAGANVESPA